MHMSENITDQHRISMEVSLGDFLPSDLTHCPSLRPLPTHWNQAIFARKQEGIAPKGFANQIPVPGLSTAQSKGALRSREQWIVSHRQ